MLQPGRKYSSENLYRFGFNGKENDNEVKGEGNQQDYGMRIYDPRLGKFLSVDPLIPKYPELTPYQFASNNPISGVDLDGLEWLHYNLTFNNDGSPVLNLVKIDNQKSGLFSNDNYKLCASISYKGQEYYFINYQGESGVKTTNGVEPFFDGGSYFARAGQLNTKTLVDFIANPESFTSVEEGNKYFRNELYSATIIGLTSDLINRSSNSLFKLQYRGRYTRVEQSSAKSASTIHGNNTSEVSNTSTKYANPSDLIRTETIGGNKASRTVGENIKLIQQGQQLAPVVLQVLIINYML
jgi:RHS repeat-associated protein